MARIGNSNLSRSGISQADVNRASRAEWRAQRERVDTARQEINALRDSLTRPSSQSSYNESQDSGNGTALDNFLNRLEEDYGHTDLDKIFADNAPVIEPPEVEEPEEEPEEPKDEKPSMEGLSDEEIRKQVADKMKPGKARMLTLNGHITMNAVRQIWTRYYIHQEKDAHSIW